MGRKAKPLERGGDEIDRISFAINFVRTSRGFVASCTLQYTNTQFSTDNERVIFALNTFPLCDCPIRCPTRACETEVVFESPPHIFNLRTWKSLMQ